MVKALLYILEVYNFICKLSTSFSGSHWPFEIAGVRVIHTGPNESSCKSECPRMKCTESVKTSETASLGFGSSLECGIPSAGNIERGTKRKITGQTCASKKMKRNDVTVVNSDSVYQ